MKHLFVLIVIKELLILIDDELVSGIERHRASFGFFFRIPLHLEAVLHEAWEDLRELYLRSFLHFVSSEFLLNEIVVERFIEKCECSSLVEL